MKKRIGIITLYGEKNYGNKLQNYATQRFFSTMGFECKTIKYCRRNIVLNQILKIKYGIFATLGLREKIPKSQKEREKVFRDFTKRNIIMGETVDYNRVPEKLKRNYDYFVTGSDQVWHNYSNTKEEIEFFMLTFADKKQRLTMSPSFGIRYEDIPKDKLPLYRVGLDGFERLSCREIEASEVIRIICGRKAEVILDPTLLINPSTWSSLSKRPENAVTDDYLVIYFLGGVTEKQRSFLNSIAKNRELKIVNLYDLNNPFYYTTGPEQFLWWMEHASIIATDSYHATIFSIIFKKQFYVYSRINGEGMENRIDTLLEKFGLNDRKNIYENDYNETTIDCERIGRVLDLERKKAVEFYSNITNK